MICRFDDIVVNFQACTLTKSGNALALERKSFAVLRLLIEHRGRLLDKDEILDSVWKDVFVTQNALTRVIAQLRKTLGDEARQSRYIKTVQTRGYRFVAEVEIMEMPEPKGPPTHLPKAAKPIESLAVLPLENYSGDPSQDYFADAMTDELITELVKIGTLKVTSRTSIMQYKKTRKSLPEIADELHVDAIVEGAALKAGERVRITAQLIYAATDSHLWAESYNCDLRDILTLQREVARTIAQEIKIKLTPQEKTGFARSEVIHPEACEAYLKGIYYFHQGRDKLPATLALLKQSFAYFETALKIEPTYALAQSALASAYRWLAGYGVPALYPKAKAAALRALELDERSAEAHATLGYILFKHEWKWSAAEAQYQRALALSPYSLFHHGYALLLSALGRHDEALREIELTEQLDPLNFTVKANLGIIHVCARQYEQAIETITRTLEIDANLSVPRWVLAWAYAEQGKFVRAVEEIHKARSLSRRDLFGLANLGYIYARAGQRHDAQKVIEKLLAMSKQQYVSGYSIATIYALLDDGERAFQWLETAYEKRDDFMTFLQVDPRLDKLRADRRFLSLMKRVGFTPNAKAVG
ncbi:MAG: winged helix-turn-helix domain-containing protein [Acidobacteria bacterium]|nr:winged helix-turn-helix domain-containing protein [Acidobacteriota bacterium]